MSLDETEFDYRQHRRQAEISHTRTLQRLRRIAFAEQDGRCAYCREKLSLKTATADHIIPLVDGGRTSRQNIAAACRNCNMAKRGTAHQVFTAEVEASKAPLITAEGGPWVCLAWVRRRLNERLEQAERRICRAVGMAVS